MTRLSPCYTLSVSDMQRRQLVTASAACISLIAYSLCKDQWRFFTGADPNRFRAIGDTYITFFRKRKQKMLNLRIFSCLFSERLGRLSRLATLTGHNIGQRFRFVKLFLCSLNV